MTSNAQPRKRPVTTDTTSSSAKRRQRQRKSKKDVSDPQSTTPSNSAQNHQRRPKVPQEQVQASHICTYSASASKWTQFADSSPSSSFPTSLRFLTYNIWSSSPDHAQSQTTAILDILEKSRVDVIALQEVSKSFESDLRKQDWVRNEWALTSLDEYWRVAGKDGQGKGKKEGSREGVMLMVRKKLVSENCEVGFVRLKRANNERAKAAVMLKLYEGDTEKVRSDSISIPSQ